MLIFKLHNLHNPERVFYFPVGQSAPSLSPFIAICSILAQPHIRRMRTYQSTLNDLERLNRLTKIGRNCSIPVEFTHHHLETIWKFLSFKYKSHRNTLIFSGLKTAPKSYQVSLLLWGFKYCSCNLH